MRLFLSAVPVLALLVLAALPARAGMCGGPTLPCETPLGTYHAVLPEGPGPHPLVIFFHGGGGWGTRIFSVRKQMAAEMAARGYVVVAPNGIKRPGSRFGPGWSFHPLFPPMRDEAAFTRALVADAQRRFGADPGRVLLTGYSIGGSLVSYLACNDPGLANAYAPVAGGFWRPTPTDCAGPVRLLHTHGWRDQTVPLEGRPTRLTGIEQGDIFETMARWRAENGCSKYRADRFVTEGAFWRRIWTHCAAGALELALHPGGHEIPPEWAGLVLDWFESLPPPDARR